MALQSHILAHKAGKQLHTKLDKAQKAVAQETAKVGRPKNVDVEG